MKLQKLWLASLCMFTVTFASTPDDIRSLLRNGNVSEALALSSQAYSAQPEDPKIRFAHGIALVENQQPDAAITIFTKLIKDYPELPEPYNNLAVVYAGKGMFPQAKEMLETVLRITPSYLVAQENLHDINTKLGISNEPAPVVKPVEVAKELPKEPPKVVVSTPLPVKTTVVTVDKVQPPAPPQLATTKPVEPAIVTPPKTTPVVASAPLPVTPPKATPVVVSAPVPVTTPTKIIDPALANVVMPHINTVAMRNKKGVDAANSKIKEQVINSLDKWLHAWAEKNMRTYFDMYASDFQPPNGKTREAWEIERTKRIQNRSRISIETVDMLIEVGSPLAVVVTFKQVYKSNVLNEVSNKMIVFIRDNDKTSDWRIGEERTSY